MRITPLSAIKAVCETFNIADDFIVIADFRGAIVALRNFSERCFQSVLFQLGGIALVTPIYAVLMQAGAGPSGAVVAAVALACLIWSPFHNAMFDLVEWRLAHRVASDRPQGLRMVHAASHEVTSMLVSTPVLMAFGGLTLMQALLVDLGFTAFYTGYAYVFNIIYDRWRPVLA